MRNVEYKTYGKRSYTTSKTNICLKNELKSRKEGTELGMELQCLTI